jgi:Mycobacterium membrane protein
MARPGIDTSVPVARARHDTPDAAGQPAAPTSPSRPPKRRWSIFGAAKRVWILLVILVVVGIAIFCVDRLHGVFGKTETTRPGAGLVNDPKPFNPKVVQYDIFGLPGATATINYLNLDAQPQQVKDVALPWTLTLTTTAPAASANIVAQGDGDSISCRITVNGEVKDEKTSNGIAAQTFCYVKSA